jgi:hypothetical protein
LTGQQTSKQNTEHESWKYCMAISSLSTGALTILYAMFNWAFIQTFNNFIPTIFATVITFILITIMNRKIPSYSLPTDDKE